MAQQEQRFSETRTIHPFPMSLRALSEVKFRMSGDQSYFDSRDWSEAGVEATPELLQSEAFAPKFKLEVNCEHLVTESGLKAADLCLSIVLQDDAAWESTRLAAWPIGTTPDEYTVDAATLKRLCGQRGLTFSVIVSPNASTKSGAGQADVIARVDFDIPSPSDGN